MVTPEGKLTDKARRRAVYYLGYPDIEQFVFDEKEEREFSADEALVGRIFTPDCKQIVYEYDFGDSWEHIVKLENRTPGGDPNHIPVCLAGENAAPVDDIGGIWDYYDYLDALQTKEGESYAYAVNALGENFDPANFDLDLANKRLKSVFKPVAKKPRKPRKSKKEKE